MFISLGQCTKVSVGLLWWLTWPPCLQTLQHVLKLGPLTAGLALAHLPKFPVLANSLPEGQKRWLQPCLSTLVLQIQATQAIHHATVKLLMTGQPLDSHGRCSRTRRSPDPDKALVSADLARTPPRLVPADRSSIAQGAVLSHLVMHAQIQAADVVAYTRQALNGLILASTRTLVPVLGAQNFQLLSMHEDPM